MRTPQLEAWVLRVIDAVSARKPIEDSRVEVKATWPEPVKAARRLAGHANAAHGEPILWVIGVDEKTGEVIGADRNELANWVPQLESHFDSFPPDLIKDCVVHAENGKPVVALLFSTDRVPFVVKNPEGGSVTREVPWRVGTRVRSAKHEDLVRMLDPIQRLPEIELLAATLEAARHAVHDAGGKKGTRVRWTARLTLFIVPPPGPDFLVVPFHKCALDFSVPGYLPGPVSIDPKLKPPTLYRRGPGDSLFSSEAINLSRTIEKAASEAVIYGPGTAYLEGQTVTEDPTVEPPKGASMSASIEPARALTAIQLSARLHLEETDSERIFRWRYEAER